MKNGTTAHVFELALIQADQDGVCRSASPELLTWCGITPPDLIGQFIFQLFSNETRANALGAWERIIGSKEPGRFEVTISSRSGSSLAVIVEVTPVRGISAVTDHWIVAIHPHRQTTNVDEGELRLLRAELSETRRRADEQLGVLKEEISQISRAKDLLVQSIDAESKGRITALEAELAAARNATQPEPTSHGEMERLRATIVDLESRLRSESAAHAAEIARLTAELKTFQERSTVAEAPSPALRDTRGSTLRAENLTLATRLRSAEDELSTLRRELTLARDHLAGRTSERSTNVELEAVTKELRSERDAHAAERTAAERIRSDFKALEARATAERTEAEQQIARVTRQLEETERARTLATTALEEEHLKLTELERTAAESSEFAQTAAREFKEVLRKHDALSQELGAAREELTRQSDLIRRATDRESELTTAMKSSQRELASLRDERDAARAESSRLENGIRDATHHHHHTSNEIFERTIAEVAVRLNRILRLFFRLPELRPEAPLCITVAAARTAAEDLVHTLERIHEFWLIEAEGLSLRRDNFGLRNWLSSAAALYEFKVTQRNLTLTMTTDPEIPEVVLTDGTLLVDALSQIADYIIETAAPGSNLTFAANVLSATLRDVRVSFDFSAPCAEYNQTTGQQLSLSVAERIMKLLGGEFRAIEAPGDLRRITVILGLLRSDGSPVPVASPRSRRRIVREEIEPMPVRPAPLAPREFNRTFGVEPSLLQADHESDPPRLKEASPAATPPTPRGAIITLTTPTDDFEGVTPSSASHDPPTEHRKPPLETPLATPLPASEIRPEDSAAGALRVLLAEDNRLNQRMIGDLLKTRGYTVVLAADGREALTHLAAARFDLALIDCEMPILDGYAAAREIRATEARIGRHTPIFAMTVYLDNDVAAKCLEAGTDELLTKPVRADALFALIDRYFPDRRP